MEVKSPPMLVHTWSASMWIKKVQLLSRPLYSQQVLHKRWIWEFIACRLSLQVKCPFWLGNPIAKVTRTSKQRYLWPQKGYGSSKYLKLDLGPLFYQKGTLSKKRQGCILLLQHCHPPSSLSGRGAHQLPIVLNIWPFTWCSLLPFIPNQT